jgi:hypothetical protein
MQKEWDWKGGGRKQDIKTFKGARFLRLSWGAGIRLYLVYPPVKDGVRSTSTIS